MDLTKLAEEAVTLYSSGASAEDAVRTVRQRHGLNSEQAARVAGETNRKLLRGTRAAARGSVPERFDTAKADRVNGAYTGEDPAATTGELRARHLSGALMTVQQLQGAVEVGAKTSSASGISLAEMHGRLQRSYPASPDFDIEQAVAELRAYSGIPTPEPASVKTSAPSAEDRLETLSYELRDAHERSGGREFDLQLKLSAAQARLASDVVRLEERSGFFLGELLYAVGEGVFSVEKASAQRAFAALAGEIFSTARVDVDALAGDARDDLGSLKMSQVQAARTRMTVRPEVRDAVDSSSDLYKSAQAYAELYDELEVFSAARAKLREGALRGLEGLGAR